MKKLSQLVKDLRTEKIIEAINQSIMLMGSIVEKLDEVRSLLEKIEVNTRKYEFIEYPNEEED